MTEGSVPGIPDQRMLFVTGMQRSGTTLLDKLLAAHPSLAVLSQPFPLLFVETKRAFLAARHQDARYPLEHFLDGQDHGLEDVTAFLGRHEVGNQEIAGALERMRDFSGQYTRISQQEALDLARSVRPGGLYGVLRQLYAGIARNPGADYCGGKETLCEEFIPYLLDRGARALVIIRDPRDVICSLNHGSGESWAGRPKPTLFNVRHWRKSVAIALSLRDHPGVCVLRYEDLVADAGPSLARIAAMLGIAAFPAVDLDQVRDQSGAVWSGNSSFAGNAAGGVGRYRQMLPPTVARYVEATCLAELRAMGYDSAMSPRDAGGVIRDFVEPYAIQREGLEDYTGDARNVQREQRRLDALLAGAGLDDPALFVTRTAGRLLANALA